MNLITIGVSHYCDKARLALELAELRYTEDAYVPILHRFAVKRAGGSGSTPTLVTGSRVIDDSTDILAFIQEHAESKWRPYPEDSQQRAEVEELEELFDEKLGPHTRRIAYFYLLPNKKLCTNMVEQVTPAWQVTVMKLGYPLFAEIMKRGMNITPAGAERSFARVDQIFDQVDALLSDGREHLVGDHLTAADITFAALAAPILLPDEYCTTMPRGGEETSEIEAFVARYSARPAGQWALKLWRELRPDGFAAIH